MADTLSLQERLRHHADWLRHEEMDTTTIEEAASELDRREAIVAAAEAWAKARRHREAVVAAGDYATRAWDEAGEQLSLASTALLALLPAAALKG